MEDGSPSRDKIGGGERRTVTESLRGPSRRKTQGRVSKERGGLENDGAGGAHMASLQALNATVAAGELGVWPRGEVPVDWIGGASGWQCLQNVAIGLSCFLSGRPRRGYQPGSVGGRGCALSQWQRADGQ